MSKNKLKAKLEIILKQTEIKVQYKLWIALRAVLEVFVVITACI
jgi:hypothetical protein